ncbi:hypothetical protein QMG90_12485 [Trabulsiella odontotermitis]|uniref:hypothetical protein n=1 Tax=Trabulsiella odontotermitis TaxID=379893 RepID=UPI0024B86A40|nr:hypothetical protein [Trabulsiella odontotermitis]WHP29636.1 hypothetical protein QMG90_12485 [Trabulsiella odontotermitis]
MTRNFLEGKVQAVFNDFENERWCSLNNFGFNSNGYSSKVNQQQYILKYYGAYFCELYGMYKKLLQSFNGDELTILSIGCGSGVDCEALNRVVIDENKTVTIKYVGIDLIDWHYRPNFPWAQFKTRCASTLQAADVEDVDLFVFPKSLTELSLDIRKHIADLIVKNSKKNPIYFINTYATYNAHDNNSINGIDEFQTISKILTDDGWQCDQEPNYYTYFIKQRWLGLDFTFFKLPDDVLPFVSELKDSCNNHNNSPQCMACNINFWPVFSNKYLAYSLLKYTREKE